MDSFLDFVFPIVGFLTCFFNFLFSYLFSKKTSKKVTSICQSCFAPVSDKEKHECSEAVLAARDLVASKFSSEQIVLFSSFIKFLEANKLDGCSD